MYTSDKLEDCRRRCGALRYYNNLKLCQKRYSETIEGRDKLRAANKRY